MERSDIREHGPRISLRSMRATCWVEQANQGAVYSVEGLALQFDGGAVWQRVVEMPPPPPPLPLRRR
jgi:hypothetical protein